MPHVHRHAHPAKHRAPAAYRHRPFGAGAQPEPPAPCARRTAATGLGRGQGRCLRPWPGHLLAALAEADGLAVRDVAEAWRVTDLGWRGRILVLGGLFDRHEAGHLPGMSLDLVVGAMDQLDWLASARAARPSGCAGRATWAMPASMPATIPTPIAAPRRWPPGRASAVGHLLHYANAEEADKRYLCDRAFDLAIGGLPGPVSRSNSAALLTAGRARRRKTGSGPAWRSTAPAPAAGRRRRARPAAGDGPVFGDHLGAPPGSGRHRRLRRRIHRARAHAHRHRGRRLCRRLSANARTGTPVRVGTCPSACWAASAWTLAVDLSAIPGAGVGSSVTLWGDHGLSAERVRAKPARWPLFTGLDPRLAVQLRSNRP